MTLIEVDDQIVEEWKELYAKKKGLEYPTLKNFTSKMLKTILDKEKRKEE